MENEDFEKQVIELEKHCKEQLERNLSKRIKEEHQTILKLIEFYKKNTLLYHVQKFSFF